MTIIECKDTGVNEKKLIRCTGFDELRTRRDLIELINGGWHEFSPDDMAGEWAVRSASKEGYLSDVNLKAYLGFLEEDGAIFDTNKALKIAFEWAWEFAAARGFDFKFSFSR